jgi:hypothetical protein
MHFVSFDNHSIDHTGICKYHSYQKPKTDIHNPRLYKLFTHGRGHGRGHEQR